MSLTLGTGPLGTRPAGDFNFSLDGAPAHRIYFEPYPRRVRAMIGDQVVLDSVRGRLLYESNHLPTLYVPIEDIDGSLLEPSGTTTYCPFKGDASYRTLRVGDRVVEDAVWLYEDPIPKAAWLEGYASLYWKKADAWFVEDERVFSHLRDPYHRVDVHETSRAVRVTLDGETIAESTRAKLLFETGLAPRVYVPREDVAAELAESAKRTTCPYKGEATYWNVGGTPDAAWSYETPLRESEPIAGHLSFDGESIEVELAEPADRFALSAA
jgi:uncharacterized protein (DUF427 family)